MAPHIINKKRILQVKVSNSRQQMVGHLLKDIVESSEKPNLTCSSDPKFDRFGFKIDADGSLEEKAERLRRVAQVELQTINRRCFHSQSQKRLLN